MFKDYDEIVREMAREMQRLADQAFAGLVKMSEGPDSFWRPPADVYETREHIEVVVEIAGLSRDQYQIELAGDGQSVLIRGQRGEQQSGCSDRVSCHQLEIYFGAFERVVPLPDGAPVDTDRIAATYKDGFLRIVLPRKVTLTGRVIPLDTEA